MRIEHCFYLVFFWYGKHVIWGVGGRHDRMVDGFITTVPVQPVPIATKL